MEPYLKQRLDLGVQPPPLPVSELQVGSAIPLKDANGVQLLGSFDVIPVGKRNCHYNTNNGKQFCKAIGAFQIACGFSNFISHFFSKCVFALHNYFYSVFCFNDF